MSAPKSNIGEASREERIRFAIAEFCHRTDAGDYDGWAKLFTDDGCFLAFGQAHIGRAALRAFIEWDQPPGRRGLHLTTDSAIVVKGEFAEVRSNFIFTACGESAWVVVAAGRYHDVLVPHGEEWLFKQREAILIGPVATQKWGAKPV